MRPLHGVVIIVALAVAVFAWASPKEDAIDFALGEMLRVGDGITSAVNTANNTALGNKHFKRCKTAYDAGVDLANISNTQIVSALGLNAVILDAPVDPRVTSRLAELKGKITNQCKNILDALDAAAGWSPS